jgi:hypothetical protein
LWVVHDFQLACLTFLRFDASVAAGTATDDIVFFYFALASAGAKGSYYPLQLF